MKEEKEEGDEKKESFQNRQSGIETSAYKTNDENNNNMDDIRKDNNILNDINENIKRDELCSYNNKEVITMVHHDCIIKEYKSSKNDLLVDDKNSTVKNVITPEIQNEQMIDKDMLNNIKMYSKKFEEKRKKDILNCYNEHNNNNVTNKKDNFSYLDNNKKVLKEKLKPDIRDIFYKSQEKEIFEYIPDSSNYYVCHNEPKELYKDIVNLNKNILDNININIYSSPLDTYLSNMMTEYTEKEHENILKEENSNIILNDEEKKNKHKHEDIQMKELIDLSTYNEPKHSYEFYKNKILKIYDNGVQVEINPDKLKYNNSIYYEYNEGMKSFLEDPLCYLQKLKCEVDDILSYIVQIGNIHSTNGTLNNEANNNKNEDNINNNNNNNINNNILNDEEIKENDKLIKHILHNREPQEVLVELLSLKKYITNILNDEKLKTYFQHEYNNKEIYQEGNEKNDKYYKNHINDQVNINTDDIDIHTLFESLQNCDDLFSNNTNIKPCNENQNDNIKSVQNFDIYTIKNKKEERHIHVTDLLNMEKKITRIENVLGIDKMSMLPYDDLNHAILDLYNKLSLLDNNKLENVKKKVQNLQSEFLNLKKYKKDLLNVSKERGNYEETIDELFKILDIWKKTHHIIPNVLSRLYQLKKIHDNADSFSSRIKDLENEQIKFCDTLNKAESNIKLIHYKMDESIELLKNTLSKTECQNSPNNE
ncbi:dynactin subunit 2, putative [Plasmodium sp. gorilla clade G2]|uniref:dynactin subunit 2, putative n=1 Tax=Plasmodium sp. gorilla clade G2 TaxID=880535 RepID=UPI000D226866|nr:dynactin subunit 2, putative [Plasmodium sp. gorilla clade G2]SOV18184.1 dynactin subunit 2, putative [Plasmodium sp. gorilla clade G2]